METIRSLSNQQRLFGTNPWNFWSCRRELAELRGQNSLFEHYGPHNGEYLSALSLKSVECLPLITINPPKMRVPVMPL